MESLLGISSNAVRSQWHTYDDATKAFVFDIVWRHRAGTLEAFFPRSAAVLREIREFCADPTLVHMVRDKHSNKQRALWHQICEELGLNHTSTGPRKKRVLTITKLPQWRWEFTDRPKQTRPPLRVRPPRDLQKEREEEDIADACFQVFCKFRAHGYDSPQHMLHHEPEFREMVKKARR